jgi:DNA-binding transcriptional regulator PaaX
VARRNIQQVVLRAIHSGAVALSSIRHPSLGIVKALARVLEEKPSAQERYYIGSVVEKLLRKKHLLVKPNGRLILSEAGKNLLEKYERQDLKIIPPRKWDGKYRVIIFDIPEFKSKLRWALRRQLMEWGFVKLQNSVWVFPYECQEIITLLKTDFGLVRNVIYMTVDSIENDRWLKDEFDLD